MNSTSKTGYGLDRLECTNNVVWNFCEEIDKGKHQGGVLTSILSNTSLLHLAVWRKGRNYGIIRCVRVTFMDISRYRNERATRPQRVNYIMR